MHTFVHIAAAFEKAKKKLCLSLVCAYIERAASKCNFYKHEIDPVSLRSVCSRHFMLQTILLLFIIILHFFCTSLCNLFRASSTLGFCLLLATVYNSDARHARCKKPYQKYRKKSKYFMEDVRLLPQAISLLY